MTYRNEFLARYGHSDHVNDLLQSNDYSASQYMHRNPSLDADTLLKVHTKGASHSAKIRTLEHPNFKHFTPSILSNSEYRFHALLNPNLSADHIREIYHKEHEKLNQSGENNYSSLHRLLSHPNAPSDVIEHSIRNSDRTTLRTGLMHPNIPDHYLTSDALESHSSESAKRAILKNPKTKTDVILKHGYESDNEVRKDAVMDHPNLPYEHVTHEIQNNTKFAANATWHPDLTRHDLDTFIANKSHATSIVPETAIAKYYPNGYDKSKNTVRNV